MEQKEEILAKIEQFIKEAPKIKRKQGTFKYLQTEDFKQDVIHLKRPYANK